MPLHTSVQTKFLKDGDIKCQVREQLEASNLAAETVNWKLIMESHLAISYKVKDTLIRILAIPLLSIYLGETKIHNHTNTSLQSDQDSSQSNSIHEGGHVYSISIAIYNLHECNPTNIKTAITEKCNNRDELC